MSTLPTPNQIYRWFINSPMTLGEISNRSGLSIDELWAILSDDGETLAAMPLSAQIRLAITVGKKKLSAGAQPGKPATVKRPARLKEKARFDDSPDVPLSTVEAPAE